MLNMLWTRISGGSANRGKRRESAEWKSQGVALKAPPTLGLRCFSGRFPNAPGQTFGQLQHLDTSDLLRGPCGNSPPRAADPRT